MSGTDHDSEGDAAAGGLSCSAEPSFDDALGAEIYDLQVGAARYAATRELFEGDLDLGRMKLLFKRFVTRVLLEASAYCNRQCTFCPNSSGVRLDRAQRDNVFDRALLKSVVQSLKSIDYDAHVLLHLYNEPMADPRLPETVAAITSELPRATVRFNTNGDYLTRERLEALAAARLTRLNVSLYGPHHGEFDTDYLKSAFERIFEIVGVRNEIVQKTPDTMRARVVFRHAGRRIPIVVFASDFNRIGYDRGKTVRTGEKTARSSPCSAVFNEFNVGWDGTVVPCCNIHPHEEGHAALAVGKIREGDDIFRVYHSKAHRAWRRSLAAFGAFESPCDTCTRLNFPGLERSENARRFNEAVGRMLA